MATFTLVLDKRRPLKNGLYNFCVRVTYGSKIFYLIISKMSEEHYKHIFIKKSMDVKSIEFRKSCNDSLVKCERIYAEMKIFNKDKFKAIFFSKEEDENENSLIMNDLFERFIKNSNNLKVTSINHYKYTKSLFNKMYPNLSILDVSTKFINDFIKKRNEEGVSPSTIESNLRNVRRVINYFMNEEPIIPNYYVYPFGKRGYSIQNLYPSKLVLSNQEIKSVIELKDFDSNKQEYARNIWLLLYHCNGSNFADLLRMKWSDIRGNCLEFYRKKTETTKRKNRKKILVPLTTELKLLIDKVGVKESEYILGKLRDGYTENMFNNKNHKLKAEINSQLEIISQKLNLSVPLRTKTARDSYATTLKRAGISKDKIGEMMDHSSSIVTEHYLASLDRETIFDINKHLL